MSPGLIGASIPIVAIVCGFLLIALVLVLRMLRVVFGASADGSRASNVEEAKLIQDIYHGLLKMEERVEALETLLLERERENEKKEAQS